MFRKILVANRGEIAVRIIRAARELGVQTVAIYSEADKKSLHVRIADEAFCVGKATSAESYLRYRDIVTIAVQSGAEAIHPGYGFLSENSDFALLCEQSGITFIGPSIEALDKMGDKAVARETMDNAKVPIPRGTTKPVTAEDDVQKIADKIGYPLLIKPANGGGGKGMRIVRSREEVVEAIKSSQTEAQAAFGSDEVYLERFIHNARHIEFQVLADNFGNTVHLGERECSVQRRHQKLLEESPSPLLDEHLRNEMGKAAVKAAKAVHYRGAGTIEFLVTEEKEFFFIEMNTRIQVEHPVTEMLTGIDLVKMQIRVAAGEPLGFKQKDIKFSGHTIECRINAEDPYNNFMPSPGKIHGLGLPGGPNVRVDTHIYSGYEVPQYYDSLLAKLIVKGEDRNGAIEKMKLALEEFSIHNVTTTIPFLTTILDDHRFRSGHYSTNLIEQIKLDEKHHHLRGFAGKIMESFKQWHLD